MKLLDFGISSKGPPVDPWAVPVVKGRRQHFNPKPNIPVTGWERPKYFPDLSSCDRICVDLETKDLNLKQLGPGWARGDGHPVGVAISTDDFHGYYPVAHEDSDIPNFPPEQVYDWLRVQLTRSNQVIVGHNLLYDLGYLAEQNIWTTGPIYDSWVGEKLIHHRGDASLEATGQRRVGEGKRAAVLLRWLTEYFGRGPTPTEDEDLDDAIKGFIYKAPASLVGPYAVSDTQLPLKIMDVQFKILEDMGLWDLFCMECALIPLFVKIRLSGVRVDLKAAEVANEKVKSDLRVLQSEVNHIAGHHIEINSRNSLGQYLVTQGVKVPLTKKTKKYSVTNKFLEKIDLPFAQKCVEFLELDKFNSSFIESAVLEKNVRGRVHGQLSPMKAITGRMAASNPNTQQIPSKNPDTMRVIRGTFVPDFGHAYWRRDDYSSIECRILAHIAVGPGAEKLREEYCGNPQTDYHSFVQKMVKEVTGLELPRKHIKTVVFSGLYGASENKMGKIMGLAKEEIGPFFEAYHSGMPYFRETMNHVSRTVQQCGYTTTVLGRRVDFDTWEPSYWIDDTDDEEARAALPLDKAVAKYGSRIRRANLHCALNYIIQGSAADLMKMALLKCWKSGVYDVIGIPSLIVHDECSGGVPDDSPAIDEAFREMQHIMETAVPFKVPVKVSAERGPDWGHTEEIT